MHYIKKFISRFLSLGLFLPTTAFGQGIKNAGSNLQSVGKQAGTEDVGDIGALVGAIINVALTLVGLIFLILMVYAGYLWMTARGEEDQIGKAKKIISASIIGLVIVTAAYAITVFIAERFA